MEKWQRMVWALAVLLLAACSSREPAHGIYYAATVHPLVEILRALTAGRAEVIGLLPPGASSHTYEPRPSEARLSERALTLFYVSPQLDAWAAQLPARSHTAVLELIPHDELHSFDAHDHDATHPVIDPHFWSDPLVVRAAIPGLVQRLSELDPDGSSVYRANGEKLSSELTSLDSEIRAQLGEHVHGKPVILFHPSLLYFLRRYGIEYAGSIEPSPGKEATPSYVMEMTAMIREKNVRAIFTEPQLARRPAEIVAESAKVPLFELDPNGGVPGRETYAELMRYNASVLKRALQ